ncbi:MAG: hypothetical protein WD250_04565 [Egibacteraceae bacterium]
MGPHGGDSDPGAEPGPSDGTGGDDPVERNRATPARTTPNRPAVGAAVTNRLRRITGAALLIATLVLVAAIIAERAS